MLFLLVKDTSLGRRAYELVFLKHSERIRRSLIRVKLYTFCSKSHMLSTLSHIKQSTRNSRKEACEHIIVILLLLLLWGFV